MDLKYLTIILITSLVLISCSNRNPKNKEVSITSGLANCQWIEGEWTNNSEQGMLVEKWSRLNDTCMSGLSFLINGKDTLFSEKIRLCVRNKEVFYLSAVQGQNGNQEVSFELIHSTSDSLIFENLLHDFPQRIIYTHPSNDSLVASIEGNKNGVQRKEFFRMYKSH